MNIIKYPKMKTLFKLNEKEEGGNWSITTGELLPETAALHYLPLEALTFTEKIDGTNMGIAIFDGEVKHIQKRNHICKANEDKAYFEVGNKAIETIDKSVITDIEYDALSNVIIYGELCGAGIQKGGNYFSDKRFLVFDIYNTQLNKFFTWDAVVYFCNLLGLETIPIIEYNKNDLNVENIKDFVINLKSVYNPEHNAEGIVIRYTSDTSADKRWVAKIRRTDF